MLTVPAHIPFTGDFGPAMTNAQTQLVWRQVEAGELRRALGVALVLLTKDRAALAEMPTNHRGGGAIECLVRARADLAELDRLLAAAILRAEVVAQPEPAEAA